MCLTPYRDLHTVASHHASNSNPRSAMFLTFREACEHLRMSPEPLRKLIKSGEIEAYKIGKGRTSHYRISVDSINAYIERVTIKPVSR